MGNTSASVGNTSAVGGTGIASGVLARTGARMGPAAMMAIVLTVLGMLMFFGSQGLPEAGFRAFTTPAMFRPVTPGRPRLLPAGASGRLDAAALDALVEMDGQPPANRPPSGPVAGGRRTSRWFSQRPW